MLEMIQAKVNLFHKSESRVRLAHVGDNMQKEDGTRD